MAKFAPDGARSAAISPVAARRRRGPPWSKGLMARALVVDRPRSRRARTESRASPTAICGPRRRLARPRPPRRARGRSDRRGRGGADRTPAPAARCAPAARGAAAPARRRRHRDREVDDRDGGCAPARDHARDVDGLHPADDADVLLEGVHAVGSLLELRGATRVDPRRGGGVRRRGDPRLPRPDAERARRRRRRARAGARPSAGRPCSRASISCRAWSARGIPARSSSNASSRSRTRTSTAATSGCATQATEGLRPLEKYLDSLPQIREIQDTWSSGRGATTSR